MRTVEINQMRRNSNNDNVSEILCVTSDGKWCKASVMDDGRVSSFGGSIWPKELSPVFDIGPACAQQPVNISVMSVVREHFSDSVAPLRLAL